MLKNEIKINLAFKMFMICNRLLYNRSMTFSVEINVKKKCKRGEWHKWSSGDNFTNLQEASCSEVFHSVFFFNPCLISHESATLRTKL